MEGATNLGGLAHTVNGVLHLAGTAPYAGFLRLQPRATFECACQCHCRRYYPAFYL
jgi:hypothetical protein